MAEWTVDASHPAMVEYKAELPCGTARVIVAAISGTTDFALRVFITQRGCTEEELVLKTGRGVHADPTGAEVFGKNLAEKALS